MFLLLAKELILVLTVASTAHILEHCIDTTAVGSSDSADRPQEARFGIHAEHLAFAYRCNLILGSEEHHHVRWCDLRWPATGPCSLREAPKNRRRVLLQGTKKRTHAVMWVV